MPNVPAVGDMILIREDGALVLPCVVKRGEISPEDRTVLSHFLEIALDDLMQLVRYRLPGDR